MYDVGAILGQPFLLVVFLTRGFCFFLAAPFAAGAAADAAPSAETDAIFCKVGKQRGKPNLGETESQLCSSKNPFVIPV